MEATREWTDHLAGHSNPTLADTRSAMKNVKVVQVTMYFQLFAYLGHFEVFLNVILGRNHDAVTSLRYLRFFVQDEQL